MQQLVIYGVLGLALDAAGQDYTQPLYWCVLTLVILSNYLARKDGYNQGLEDAEDTLVLANEILDRARAEVSKHIENIGTERKALLDVLNNTNKDTQ